MCFSIHEPAFKALGFTRDAAGVLRAPDRVKLTAVTALLKKGAKA